METSAARLRHLLIVLQPALSAKRVNHLLSVHPRPGLCAAGGEGRRFPPSNRQRARPLPRYSNCGGVNDVGVESNAINTRGRVCGMILGSPSSDELRTDGLVVLRKRHRSPAPAPLPPPTEAARASLRLLQTSPRYSAVCQSDGVHPREGGLTWA